MDIIQGFNKILKDALWANDLCALAKKEERKRILNKMKELKDRKFPRGERLWCAECAERIYKELKKE